MSTTTTVGLMGVVCSSGFVLGSTAWFFFLQSASMIKFMGKAKFIPVQMHLVKLLFLSLEVACIVNTVVTIALLNTSVVSPILASSVLATLAVALNRRVIVPKALEAGARSMRKDDHADSSAVGFAKDGGGNETKVWHRTVVIFVVVMLVGTVRNLHAAVTLHQ